VHLNPKHLQLWQKILSEGFGLAYPYTFELVDNSFGNARFSTLFIGSVITAKARLTNVAKTLTITPSELSIQKVKIIYKDVKFTDRYDK